MARRGKNVPISDSDGRDRGASLKDLVRLLGLSPTTISLILNQSPNAKSIPQATHDKVIAAARRLNYRPNFLAKSLRSQRSYAIGTIVPEASDGYASLVVGGIEDVLIDRGYMYLATSHRHSVRQLELLTRRLWERRVEGLIVVDTPYEIKTPLPIVSVSGHGAYKGVTNLILDHEMAADLGIGHLKSLGHRRIAAIQGQPFSSDTGVRWKAIERAARRHGVPIDPALVVQLEGDSPSPETGYRAATQLTQRGVPFTAVFAFNDVSAFGVIRALEDRGLRVPHSVSVLGFDDVWSAAFHIPALTTIRQPLRQMGALAAETLLKRIGRGNASEYPPVIEVMPELIVRESTAPPPDEAETVANWASHRDRATV
jgi:LacI family transcriptional regulator